MFVHKKNSVFKAKVSPGPCTCANRLRGRYADCRVNLKEFLPSSLIKILSDAGLTLRNFAAVDYK